MEGEWRAGMDLRQTSRARTVARHFLEDSTHAVDDDSSTGEEEDAPRGREGRCRRADSVAGRGQRVCTGGRRRIATGAARGRWDVTARDGVTRLLRRAHTRSAIARGRRITAAARLGTAATRHCTSCPVGPDAIHGEVTVDVGAGSWIAPGIEVTHAGVRAALIRVALGRTLRTGRGAARLCTATAVTDGIGITASRSPAFTGRASLTRRAR